MRVAGVMVALVIATVTIGAAQQKKGAKAQKDDVCASPATQLDFTQCAEKDLEKADAALAAIYVPLLKGLDEDHKPILEKSQQAWEKFRDAECMLQSSESLGGSMQAQLYDGCMAAMASERARDLKETRKTLSEFISR